MQKISSLGFYNPNQVNKRNHIHFKAQLTYRKIVYYDIKDQTKKENN